MRETDNPTPPHDPIYFAVRVKPPVLKRKKYFYFLTHQEAIDHASRYDIVKKQEGKTWRHASTDGSVVVYASLDLEHVRERMREPKFARILTGLSKIWRVDKETALRILNYDCPLRRAAAIAIGLSGGKP